MDEANVCLAAHAEQEQLVEKPDIVRGIVRVSGPFTPTSAREPVSTVLFPGGLILVLGSGPAARRASCQPTNESSPNGPCCLQSPTVARIAVRLSTGRCAPVPAAFALSAGTRIVPPQGRR